MLKFRWIAGALVLAASTAAQADALTILTDAELLKRAQKDVAQVGLEEADSLNFGLSTCEVVTLGQKAQHFECERALTVYWTHYSRGRDIDNYVAALGTLFSAFDNNGANPSEGMVNAYKHATVDLLKLTRSLNERYHALNK